MFVKMLVQLIVFLCVRSIPLVVASVDEVDSEESHSSPDTGLANESVTIDGVILETFFTALSFGAVVIWITNTKRNRSKVTRKAPKVASDAIDGFSTPCALTSRRRTSTRDTIDAGTLVDAVRTGRARELPGLLDRAFVQNDHAGKEVLLLACLKACAARRSFEEALASYDHVRDQLAEINYSTLSLLLYCAVEAGQFVRSKQCWKQLLETQKLAGLDFVNIVHCYAVTSDANGLTDTLNELEQKGVKFDSCARNRALQWCVVLNALPLAIVLLDDDRVFGQPADVVGVNTVVKGCSTSGAHNLAFQIHDRMRARGVESSDVTYGILLQACITAGNFSHCKRIFADMKSAGVTPNIVHYTTYMKCLVLTGNLEELALIFDEMLLSESARPDFVTYSTLLKAYADVGEVGRSLRVVEQMTSNGIKGDTIMFHIVLTGCCVKPMKAEEVLDVCQKCREHGLIPSNSTLSILVKAFARSGSWNEALEVITTAPERMQVQPEARIYAQLAQGCAREGNRDFATKIYAAMLLQFASAKMRVEPSANVRMQGICKSAFSQLLYRASIDADGLLNSAQVEALQRKGANLKAGLA